MTPLLTERYADQIRGTLHCFDRILVQGILTPLSYGRGITNYFYEHDLRIFSFTEWAKPLREAIRENAARLAAEAGLEIEVVRKKKVRKEDRVQEILEARGRHPGLVCILAAMERCRTFQPWHDRATQRCYFRPKEGCCLHYYFYFLDEELGLCWVRVPTWAPFRLQVYWNGHGWLAAQLTRQKIGFTLVDNAFTNLADFEGAQKIADHLRVGSIYQKLDRLAQRCCPVTQSLGLRYQWSVDQVEYATDIIFERASDLQAFYEPLLRRLVQVVKPRQIATFLGKKINRTYQDEVGNRYDVRQLGTRIRHTMGPASLKMYDKLGHILRIETTTNDVSFFPQYREVMGRGGRRYRRWTKMRKTVSGLSDVAGVMYAANRRYLTFLSALDLEPNRVGRAKLDQISETVRIDGRPYRGFNFFSRHDERLLEALSQGEFQINGVRNKDLRHRFPDLNSAQISRLLQRLRHHNILRSVPKTYKYYLTKFGKQVISTGSKLRDLFLVPQLALEAQA